MKKGLFFAGAAVIAAIAVVLMYLAAAVVSVIIGVALAEFLLWLPYVNFEKYLVPIPEFPYLLHAALAIIALSKIGASFSVSAKRADSK